MKDRNRAARRLIAAFVLALVIGIPQLASADTSSPFRFETYQSLDDMQKFVEENFPKGTPRDTLRKTFVDEGGATLKLHPNQAGIEKYIYDINLCSYYVWRWNISADYDNDGNLLQIYLNGLKDGRVQKMDEKAPPGKKASIYKAQRPRPEAYKGEKSLGFLLLDKDSDAKTIDDQKLIGAGPSRADPMNMGRMVVYVEVDPWRSLFDSDAADRIVPYAGDCVAVDAFIKKMKQAQPK